MKMHPCPSLRSNKHLIIYDIFQIMYFGASKACSKYTLYYQIKIHKLKFFSITCFH